MIEYLKGDILKLQPFFAVIVVNNVGYGVNIPLTASKVISEKKDNVELFIHTIHKEDNFSLFGFINEEEKELFRILISVQGIGPRLALNIISYVTINEFRKAVLEKDLTSLTSIDGIGRKKAEKILFELKEKFSDFYGTEEYAATGIDLDAANALVNLGFNKNSISKVLKLEDIKNIGELEEKIKKALQKLSSI